MNQRGPKDVMYRLLYLGRHGQGYHNVGIMFYGDAARDVAFVFSLRIRIPTQIKASAAEGRFVPLL